ncbi:MAG: Lipoate-protein ligase A subunit 1 [Candidatus Methanoperedens nitroreducens]|uniref:Lipoate-protein ligase A subunit 1 n=1 Tax=Candidatus Methanoperedens nitratireducens TaxID=1392998 RepID=A0A0P8DWX3_9EURY|nr:biotin/lipoate A/B protein ligase family protein [Candidatus Methanoperedens sp. BLZ2]KAB2945616.1 MAG: lipoate--protein ligase family protein [Candidatus Methanoperedens sp.]KPQ42166.1 MAG: Lipoate-protein ligase A subunit 1 [Candidatus Methanoperedens sp. BLZ1]MBZ0176092.1 lipoate--protein ligase family protein [Candidatus Methanoperedens nitroreducens]MCX9079385.1 biotin/lipoate A/B protein ligase family protein [Candidatus Methanoperedens sp.]
MKDKWRFIDLDKIDGFKSAALFESIAKHVGSGLSPDTIFFWRVRSPVIYLGYHQCVEDEINIDYCIENNIGIVRRILGGGCGFCDEDQILFSCIGKEDGIIPPDIQAAYEKVLGGVVNALITLGAGGEIEPARNAVYSKGKKISGNAQGRLDGAVLVNGSLLMDFDFGLMDRALKNPTKNLYPVNTAREGMITLKDMGIMDIDLVKKALKEGFETALGIGTYPGLLTENEINTADQLLGKYQDHNWTYRMDIKRSKRLQRKTSSLLLLR